MDANSHDAQILDTFQCGLQTSINNAIAEHRCVMFIYNCCVLSLTECGFKVHTQMLTLLNEPWEVEIPDWQSVYWLDDQLQDW